MCPPLSLFPQPPAFIGPHTVKARAESWRWTAFVPSFLFPLLQTATTSWPHPSSSRPERRTTTTHEWKATIPLMLSTSTRGKGPPWQATKYSPWAPMGWETLHASPPRKVVCDAGELEEVHPPLIDSPLCWTHARQVVEANQPGSGSGNGTKHGNTIFHCKHPVVLLRMGAMKGTFLG